LRQCEYGFPVVGDATGINPTATLVLARFVELVRLDERREHKTVWGETDFEFQETFGDDFTAAVREDRLRKDVIEGDTEAGGAEVRMIKEGGMLQLQH